MPRCVCCGRLQLSKPLAPGGYCEICNTCESRIAISKAIIKSSWLSTDQSSKYKNLLNTLQTNKQKGFYIAEILKDIDTPEAWYCMAIAYQLQGAKFRPEQIKYSRKLLDCGCNLEKQDMVYIYNLLADAYEGEYMFEEAINTHELLLSKQVDYSPARIKIARLMVKQHRIDEAIKMLKEEHKQLKNKPVYCTDLFTGKKKLDPIHKTDLLALSWHIKEMTAKKKRGYVYRPRKKGKLPTIPEK